MSAFSCCVCWNDGFRMRVESLSPSRSFCLSFFCCGFPEASNSRDSVNPLQLSLRSQHRPPNTPFLKRMNCVRLPSLSPEILQATSEHAAPAKRGLRWEQLRTIKTCSRQYSNIVLFQSWSSMKKTKRNQPHFSPSLSTTANSLFPAEDVNLKNILTIRKL